MYIQYTNNLNAEEIKSLFRFHFTLHWAGYWRCIGNEHTSFASKHKPTPNYGHINIFAMDWPCECTVTVVRAYSLSVSLFSCMDHHSLHIFSLWAHIHSHCACACACAYSIYIQLRWMSKGSNERTHTHTKNLFSIQWYLLFPFA